MNGITKKLLLAILAVICLDAYAVAIEIKPVSVLANSGYEGDTLLKMRHGSYPSGVVIDEDLTLWRSAAPNRIERIALDGRLIASYRVENTHMGHPQHNIRLALVNDYIVMLNVHNGRVYSIRRDADPELESARALDLNPPISFWYGSGIGSHGVGGHAIVDSRSAIHGINPETGDTIKLFDLPENVTEHGTETTADGIIYATSGNRTRAFELDGTLLHEGNGMVGRISAVPNALLSFSWGLMQRAPLDLRVVERMFWNTNIEVGRLGQVAGISHNTFAFASEAGPIYIGELAGERLIFTRRYGSITPRAVGLSESGDVMVSSYGGILGWKLNDTADAIPFSTHGFADILNVQQIASRGRFTWGIKQGYRSTEPMQVWTWPPTRYGIQWSNLEGERPARPLGLAVTYDWKVFISAENDANLYTTTASQNGHFAKDVAKVKWAGRNPFTSPTALAGWSEGRLLVADGGEVVLIAPEAEGYSEVWRLKSWGDAPDQSFGERIHIAVSHNYLIVSDTTRHRVLVFDIAERTLLAQIGNTDIAGAKVGEFNQPAHIAATGLQLVVNDTENQRIVAFEFMP